MQFYLICALLFSLLISIFAIQNTEIVTISFISWHFDVSLVLVILGSAAVGALMLLMLGLSRQVGSWIKIRELNQSKLDLEKKLSLLEKQSAEDKANQIITENPPNV